MSEQFLFLPKEVYFLRLAKNEIEFLRRADTFRFIFLPHCLMIMPNDRPVEVVKAGAQFIELPPWIHFREALAEVVSPSYTYWNADTICRTCFRRQVI